MNRRRVMFRVSLLIPLIFIPEVVVYWTSPAVEESFAEIGIQTASSSEGLDLLTQLRSLPDVEVMKIER